MSYASYGSDILSKRPSYGVTLVSQVTGQFFSGELRVVTQVTRVTPVTDGVTECLGEKVKLRKLRKLHKLRANFFRRRLVSYGSYASYGWCQRIFVRKCQVTEVREVTQVTGQFFPGELRMVTTVTQVT